MAHVAVVTRDPAADAELVGLAGHPWVVPAPAPDVLSVLRAALDRDPPPSLAAIPAQAAAPALVALVPDALARHRRLGVPAVATRDTLLDVGRKIDAYGPDIEAGWLLGLLRADVVGLGRLQVERVAGPGGRAVHIPEGGPLTPASVDHSLIRARELLGDAPLVCTSWLLDPALRAGLPAESNIVRFAARFTLAAQAPTEPATRTDGPTPGDRAVARFVFRRPVEDVLDPALVEPRTRLERLVADHLRSGRHWTEPRGVLTAP